MEENSIYNAEGGFLFLSFNGFFEGWRGFEPQSPTNETQVINSLSLGQPLLRWVINPSLRASSGRRLSERFQLLQVFQPTSYTLNLWVFVNGNSNPSPKIFIHLSGTFPKCLGRFYTLVRFYRSESVNFKQGNIHRLVIFFSLITIDLTNKICKSQGFFWLFLR